MVILFNTRSGVVIAFNLILILLIIFLLSSCASSNVSRTTATNVDLGIKNAKSLAYGVYNGDAGESYQNSSQATKGAIIGGAVGGATGLVASSIGFLPGLATGALLGASYGAYIDYNTNSEDRLENRGANIIELGDHVLIILQSARIFQAYTATIKPQSYSTLYLVAKYVNRYTKMLVKISVYTNDSGSPAADAALSTQQAHAVAKFLVASGIDARLLYAVGCGGTRLVSSTSADWDASNNYRIEITLEKLYV